MFVQSYLTILAGCLSCVASLPTDLASVQARDSSKKYLSLPVSIVRNNFTNSSVALQQSKREDVSTPITNQHYYYTIDLLVGSNQQPITLGVDTGSSDMWVVDNTAQCEGGADCMSSGTFDPSRSNTANKLDEQFSLTYIDHTQTSGFYYKDDITFPGGPTLKQFQFADATKTSLSHGMLGIGLNTSEAPVFSGNSKTMYADFPWALKDQGLIAKAAYSLFLNTRSATSGTLLFGGIDNAKIDGGLVELPGAYPSRLGIQGDSITIDGTTTNLGQGVVLDSGYTYSRLPKAVVDAIGSSMSGSQPQSGDYPYYVDCDQPDKSVTFSFGNGKKTIQVPYSSFVFPGGPSGGSCSITLSYSTDGDYNNEPTLGDDVLRNIYVVYDIEDNKMSIGQVKYTTDSDITPIQ